MINFDPKGSFIDFANANSRKSRAISNLASGSQEDLRLRDGGSFSMNLKIQGQVSVERKLLNGMQNILSFSQVQDGHLKHLADLLSRMSELASMATDTTKSSTDILNYNSEFMDLVDQFDAVQNETFNGIKLFGSGTTEESTELLNSLKDHWLAATEKLVQEEYGWTADSSDSWDLVIEENGAVGGSAAFVRSSWSIPSYESEVKTLSIDLPDLTAPHTVGNSTADTLIAHEMVHLLQAQNTYMGDQAGGNPNRDMTWLAEGLAEFIRGADNRANASKNSLGTAALVQLPGNGLNGGSDDYAGAYLAVKYLDNQIRSSGAAVVNGVNAADGVKHLTTWMKAQRDANAGASASGLNQYIETHLNGAHGYGVGNSTATSGQAIDDFLDDFEGANGQAFVNGLNLTDTDTGSVHGSEYGGAAKSTANVVRDDAAYLTGFNSQLTYVEEESSEPITMFITGDGEESILNPVSTISFGDTNTYNIKNAKSATQTMDHIDALLESVAKIRATVGSNMEVTQNNLDLLSNRNTYLQKSISRTQDTDFAKETAEIARTEILLQMNLSMNIQARETSQSITLTLLQ
jgi:flagellin